MEVLARRLCEAVENEDAQEVEDLLQSGADPNFVLPNNGIAAIHLAAGKESESALRCLTLILQHGGNPNVRSIEELTPVHVAASWGCCKVLVALLRIGGDPTLQDQDGNTASDLALMERNRRCVVALQEYIERSTLKDKNCGLCDSILSDDITHISNISLLLESSYKHSPFNSTSIFPLAPIPVHRNIGEHMDNAALSSRIEFSGLGVKESEMKGYSEILNNIQVSMSNGAYLLCLNSNKAPNTNVDCSLVQSVALTENCTNPKDSLESNIVLYDDGAKMDLHAATSSLMDPKMFSVRIADFDVTSPDHVYVYSRESSSYEDIENTFVVLDKEREEHTGKDVSCSTTYNSCQSESPSLGENSCNLMRVKGINSHFLDKDMTRTCSKSVKDAEAPLEAKSCNTLDLKVPAMEATSLLQKRDIVMNTRVNMSACSPNSNAHNKGTSRVLGSSQTQIVEASQRAIEPSPTVSIDGAAEYYNQERDNQCLKNQLKNMMFLTKAQTSDQSQHHTASMQEQFGISEPSISDTLPVTHQGNPFGEKANVLNEQLKTMMILTKVQQSPSHSNSTSDTPANELDLQVVRDKCDTAMNAEFRKMMMATKAFESPHGADQEKSRCFFTPRTKRRLQSSNSRHSNSSLFDESVEMPQRGRRVRSPGGTIQSPSSSQICGSRRTLFTSSLASRKQTSEVRESGQNSSLIISDIPTGPISMRATTNKLVDSEATLNLSDFLTDDVSSSDTEARKCGLQLTKVSGDPVVDQMVSGNTWLTEEGEDNSGELGQGDVNTQFSHSFPVSQSNDSLVHSTQLEDPTGKLINGDNKPRYSFSRLSSIAKDEDMQNTCQLNRILDSDSQVVPLSPGGRPVNMSKTESMDFLYQDKEKGHKLIERHISCTDTSYSSSTENSDDTVIYYWRDYHTVTQKINKFDSNRVAVELYRLSNNDIARKLMELGEDVGPVSTQNRKMCILLLDKCLKKSSNRKTRWNTGYNPELSVALHTSNIPDCRSDETMLSQEFDKPDKTRKWREGVLKSSFNYLLMDPRVTQNLPARYHSLSENECFRTFIGSVFYVGKGKRSRPYCHLYEALTHYNDSNKQACPKVQHIVDIWKSGLGVISLHCFQNTIPVEAYTREACMVDAIGLKMLTNQKKGVYYGQVQSWPPARQRHLGVFMLHRAMQIFLAEGERQLRPPDIRT
ncbi:ankyrin repeat and LEM domain-containing protein 1 [Spea bombifrons]|uniref:ankyrin repeat and LEM domain-containing protein 1 n=1 Tax=Spea bombifrons TaxID=233779 RepID=UPI00234A7EF4|nr:ankyrin repeat and LEM domain-containing protein 1 [Spea bombifrons]